MEEPGRGIEVRILRALAWIVLVGGILLGLFVMAFAGTETATTIGDGEFRMEGDGSRGAAFVFGLLVIVGSIVGWAQLWAFARITEGVAALSFNVRRMREEAQPPSAP